jgi:hypothetical protein
VEFHREDGEGGAAQKWIDGNLPTCPLCRTPSLWQVSVGVEQEALERWCFQCSNCKAVLSTIPPTSASVRAGPADDMEAPIEINVRIDTVVRKEDEDFVGEEFPLNELQQWAEENES